MFERRTKTVIQAKEHHNTEAKNTLRNVVVSLHQILEIDRLQYKISLRSIKNKKLTRHS